MARHSRLGRRTISSCVFAAVLTLSSILPRAQAEMQCAPQGTSVQYPTTDSLYQNETKAWRNVTNKRYLEGSCTDVAVSGYEGYPTKRCFYKNADAGGAYYPALQAQVILLDPSAEQLAVWSIHACRAKGATTDVQLHECLEKLRDHVRKQNSAQFPVAGSVVESECNSSGKYSHGCDALSESDKARQPRNTWFRNGVSIYYDDVRWDANAHSKEDFDQIFDLGNSDKHVTKTLEYARVAGATRQDWRNWRKHVDKPLIPDGVTETSIDGNGWQSVAREVHKRACKTDSNELFDAVAFAQRKD